MTAVPNTAQDQNAPPTPAPAVLVVDDSPPTARALARVLSNAGYRATVRVILATRDRGDKGDASRCHIFRGRVRVVREHGRWVYDPPGLRELHRGGIDPSSDARCDRLFP